MRKSAPLADHPASEATRSKARVLQLPVTTLTLAPIYVTAAPVAAPPTDSSLTDAVDGLYYDSGYAMEYGDLCEKLYASTEPASVFQTLKVTYDYEMTLSVEQPVPQGYTQLSYWTPALEWGTLWSVAQELGLHGCEFKDNDSFQSQIRPSLIVSLSSLQTDRLDSTVEGASCQFLSTDSGECYPMVGSMTAQFVGDESTSTAVQDYLLNIIQTQMNQDLVLTGAVESTVYLGNRQALLETEAPSSAPSAIQIAAAPPAPASATPVLSPSTNSSNNATAILASSLSVAGALVLVAALAILVVSRRKKRSYSDRKISIISEVDELEHVETGSSRHSTESQGDESKSPIPSPTNSNNIPPLTLPELLADTLADADRSVLTDGTIGSGEAVTILSGGDTTVVSGSSDDSDKAVGENMDAQSVIMDDGNKSLELPPKAPQGPSKQPPPVQQTLAKRRRKKKKKKKKMNQALIPHVSSRENIHAMETISEDNGDDEGGSDDDDCSDSEYSYETDESGSRSRDPSPIRSDGGSSELYPQSYAP